MKEQTVKTLKALKKLLKKTLPGKISKVLKSYEDFSETQAPCDAKSFSAYHCALKSAVSHMETLLKLEKWTGDDVAGSQSAETFDIVKYLQEAQKLKAVEDDNEEDES